MKKFIATLWEGMKMFSVDATIMVVSLIMVVVWFFNPEVNLTPMCGFLAVYSSYTILRLNSYLKQIKDLQK